MNGRMFSCVLMMGLLLAAAPSVSRAAAQGQSRSPAASTTQPPSPDEVVDALAAKLNLSDNQKTQITPIIADRQQKLQALRSDSSIRPMQKMGKMKGIFEDSDKKIKAVLTDQQKQQYVQMEQQMRQQMRERMQNRRASGGNSPQ